jgi:hypothetical protein
LAHCKEVEQKQDEENQLMQSRETQSPSNTVNPPNGGVPVAIDKCFFLFHLSQ